MPDCIDLHCHSTASDGRARPEELIAKAKAIGLRALALTDHDTVAGLEAFSAAGRASGIETVPGVEVSAESKKGTMHILGLLVNPAHASFKEFLGQLAAGRKVRNPQIVDKLCELGLKLTMEEVELEAGVKDDGPGGGAIDKSVGRPHIAAVLIKKGYVKDKQEAFDKYLAKGAPAYFSRFTASPEESIRQIHAAGGLAVLAHPHYLSSDAAELEQLVGKLKEAGLDGIEVFYSTHTREQTALSQKLAQQFDLVPSGGSDFHGEQGRSGVSVELGSGIERNLAIPYSILEGLKARQRQVHG